MTERGFIKCGTNPAVVKQEWLLKTINDYLSGGGVSISNLIYNPRNYYVEYDCNIADSHTHIPHLPSFAQGILTGLLMAKGVEVI